MKYTFTGKNITISDSTKEKAMQKINRLEKLLPQDAEVFVTIGVTKLEHKVEVTVPLHKRILRAEVVSNDTITALDEVVDVLEKQMVKYKSRLRHRSRRDNSYKEESLFYVKESMKDEEDTATEESGVKIGKTKKFALKPMDAEEAVMEMELLGHNFYVFRNGDTDEVNVVYKRQDGSYGLIEPEF